MIAPRLARTELGLQSHSAVPFSPKDSLLLLAFLLVLATLTPAANAVDGQDVVETIEVESSERSRIEGSLDWTESSLVVYGEGAAPAEANPVRARLMGFRAAKLVAYRNLLEIIGEVQIDGQTTVSMAMVSDDSIRARVEGIVKGARVLTGSREQEGELFRIALKLDLLGEMADAVLPLPDSTSAESPARDLPSLELTESDSLLVFVPPEPYTGLIVDARGTDLTPSMSPRIIDTDDRVIYSADHVDRDYAVRLGIVGYDKDIARAASSDRIGGTEANPFVVEAVALSGLYNSDVVISRDSGVRARMADMEGDFLTQCRVIFILGPEPPSVETSGYESVFVDSTARDYLDEEPIDDGFIDELLEETEPVEPEMGEGGF